MLSTGRRHLILFRSLGIHFNTSHIFSSTNVTVILVLGCINIRRCILSFGYPPWNHSQHPSCLTSFVCWPFSFSSLLSICVNQICLKQRITCHIVYCLYWFFFFSNWSLMGSSIWFVSSCSTCHPEVANFMSRQLEKYNTCTY